MTRRFRSFVSTAALVWAAAAAAAPAHPARKPAATKPAAAPRAAVSFLPDSTILARVDKRTITVFDFRDRWFSSDPTTRNATDLAGRTAFLQSLVDREVLSLEAVAAGTKLTPGDRWSLNNYEDQLLTMRLYQRRVEDPATPTEQDLHAVYDLMAWRLRLRYMLFADEATARAVRAELVSGRTTWEAAARKHSLGPDSLVRGDLGWLTLSDLPPIAASTVFRLRPPLYSDVLLDQDGYKIWQCLAREPQPLPPFHSIRRTLWMRARTAAMAPLETKFFAGMRERLQPAYDTTAIVWLADRFAEANHGLGDPMSGIDMRSRVPVIPAADTGRVLARAGKQVYTVGRLVTAYTNITPLRRNRITTPSSLFAMLERMVLQPTIAETARAEGLDRAPDVAAEMQKQREGRLVAHLYDDSVQARMTYDPRANRRYYEQHRKDYVSRDHVRYALLLRRTEAGADSAIARLAAGERADAMWAADSAAGWRGGGTRDLYEGQGHTFYKMLMEELREGQSTKMWLSLDSLWAVFHIVQHETPRQMEFAEVADLVGESMENLQAERLLHDMIARLRRRHRIVQHPERLMRVPLEDPAGDMPVRTD